MSSRKNGRRTARTPDGTCGQPERELLAWPLIVPGNPVLGGAVFPQAKCLGGNGPHYGRLHCGGVPDICLVWSNCRRGHQTFVRYARPQGHTGHLSGTPTTAGKSPFHGKVSKGTWKWKNGIWRAWNAKRKKSKKEKKTAGVKIMYPIPTTGIRLITPRAAQLASH